MLGTPPTPNKKGISPLPNVIGGVGDAALRIIEEAQPYKWGDDFSLHPLYVLHWLNIRDKHRHIPIRGASFTKFEFVGDPPHGPYIAHGTTVGSDENGAELVFRPDDPTMDVEAHAYLQVVVHEPELGRDRPLLETLLKIEEAVHVVVNGMRDACFPDDDAIFPE